VRRATVGHMRYELKITISLSLPSISGYDYLICSLRVRPIKNKLKQKTILIDGFFK